MIYLPNRNESFTDNKLIDLTVLFHRLCWWDLTYVKTVYYGGHFDYLEVKTKFPNGYEIFRYYPNCQVEMVEHYSEA